MGIKKLLSSTWFRDQERSSNINVRLKAHEREAIQAKADEYANGQVSVWLRYCALTMKKPKATDLVPEAEA